MTREQFLKYKNYEQQNKQDKILLTVFGLILGFILGLKIGLSSDKPHLSIVEVYEKGDCFFPARDGQVDKLLVIEKGKYSLLVQSLPDGAQRTVTGEYDNTRRVDCFHSFEKSKEN